MHPSLSAVGSMPFSSSFFISPNLHLEYNFCFGPGTYTLAGPAQYNPVTAYSGVNVNCETTGWPRSYRKYILQIRQPSQYGYAKLQYRFAVTSGSPSAWKFAETEPVYRAGYPAKPQRKGLLALFPSSADHSVKSVYCLFSTFLGETEPWLRQQMHI